MPQVFHPSLNTVSRVTIFGAVFIVASAFVIGGTVVRSPYVTEVGVIREQPVPFSHQHHVGDVGIDCRYCHHTVEAQASAGMPATGVCLDCHSHLWRDSPLLAPVHESWETRRPLAWTRVHDLPDFVYFHHGIHVANGIDCATCHGRVEDMPLMHRVHSLHMEWCVDCHRDSALAAHDPASADDPETAERVAAVLDGLPPGHNAYRLTNCSICHR
jgi:hypothetical protein